jgi:hypothetical protein
MIIAFQLLNQGRLERWQYDEDERLWRLHWEENGWNVSREPAREVEPGDWIGPCRRETSLASAWLWVATKCEVARCIVGRE